MKIIGESLEANIQEREMTDQKLLAAAFVKNNVINNELCVGCSACVSVCQTHALTLGQDADGFYKPVLNHEKCIDCGNCYEICPLNNPSYKNEISPPCYAFEGDSSLEQTSTSAGGFQVLAKHFLRHSGKVVGAAWDQDMRLVHIMVDNEKDLPQLYKSKYVQSFMGDIYEQTRKELDSNTAVLFSGVGCQIAGLYAALRRDYPNLYTIDLLCTHAPSYGMLRRYWDETFGKNNVKSADFRAKDDKVFALHYHYHYHYPYMNKLEHYDSHWNDPWFKAFHWRISTAPHCEKCKFACLPRQGDITFGDFHGIEAQDPLFRKFHTQAALLNNPKGAELFNILKTHMTKVKEEPLKALEDANNVSSFLYPIHPARDRFFALSRQMDISKALDMALDNKSDTIDATLCKEINNKPAKIKITLRKIIKYLLPYGLVRFFQLFIK